jgi:high-affinity Fe2+/Pb2+ permease
LGSFLAGLVGYRAQPSSLEGMAYVLYVAVAGALILGVGRTADPETADPPAVRV